MLTPNVVKPTTSAGGDRVNRNIQAKWDSRESAPFYYHRQSDMVEDTPCATCGAPLHRYEVEEHESACETIAASDGKDKELPQADLPEEEETPEGALEEFLED